MTKSANEPDVDISLTKAEALVLFDLLSRFSNTEKLNIEHEQKNVCYGTFAVY